MLVSITALGSKSDTAESCAGRVIEYLDGRGTERGGQGPGVAVGVVPQGSESNLIAYYADSVEGPGTWMGRGVAEVRLEGEVATDDFRHVLLGQEPKTGVQLIKATGSAGRTNHDRPRRPISRKSLGDQPIALSAAAALLGVTPQYLRRVAKRGESLRKQRADDIAAGRELAPFPDSYFEAEREKGRRGWRVNPDEVIRFANERDEPAVVVGYDVTASAPKSVSILWATGSAKERAAILASIDAATRVAVDYLESNAAYVRKGGEQQVASGLLAASYLHATSRALDPQLHRHTVIANMASTLDDEILTLDGRALFAHQKTAGYLAGAELRHQLGRRLGLSWGTVVNGLADVEGVDRGVIKAMSKRSHEIDAAMELVDATSAAARQVAAYDTRTPKSGAVDLDFLQAGWLETLSSLGFDEQARSACFDHGEPRELDDADRAWVMRWLSSADGATERLNAFSRQDVIQKLATELNDRAGAEELCELADRFIGQRNVVELHVEGRRTDQGPLYTTIEMASVERELVAIFQRGINADHGLVPPKVAEGVLKMHSDLGSDQSAMVRGLVTSGHRLQCIVGPAGSGKTTALAVACRIFETAGFEPIGCSINGTATEVLAEEAGIDARTVASLLTRLDTADQPVLSSRSVVIVDESSTISNRELLRLARHVESAGARLRLIGDPAQHSAVLAGGGWRYLVKRNPDLAPALVEQRRQIGPEMESVRQALKGLREGSKSGAIGRLVRAGRVTEAPSLECLIDSAVDDWYADRLRRLDDSKQKVTSVTTSSHLVRREVIQRARQRLTDDGTLSGPCIDVFEGVFQAGDEVIARSQSKELRPSGVSKKSHLRNGSRGRVISVAGDGQSMTVDFERLGVVVIPRSFLEDEIRPGIIGGIAHAYCLTTAAAQGQTHESGRTIASDNVGLESLYVGLSRGRTDARLYLVRQHDVSAGRSDDPKLPILAPTDTAVERLSRHLDASRPEALASELDASVIAVSQAMGQYGLRELTERVADDPKNVFWKRLLYAERSIVVSSALQSPSDQVLSLLGQRPPLSAERDVWDTAVGCAHVYIATWQPTPLEDDRLFGFLGPTPTSPALADFERAIEALGDAVALSLANQSPGDLTKLLASVALAERPPTGLQRWFQEPVQQKIEVVRRAQALQVRSAVKRPASYVLDVLGSRRASDDSDAWSRRATEIERYRHSKGWRPSDGAIDGSGSVAGAIGQRPSDPVEQLHWDQAHKAVVDTAAGSGISPTLS